MAARYRQLDGYPPEASAAGVLARLLDALGFRLYWATDGLRREDYDFLPEGGKNSIGDLLQHLWVLINWIGVQFTGESEARPEAVADTREAILSRIEVLRDGVAAMSAEELAALTIEGLPFWHMINGPMSDAIWHVGQISMLRRLAGNPAPVANFFTGRPPR